MSILNLGTLSAKLAMDTTGVSKSVHEFKGGMAEMASAVAGGTAAFQLVEAVATTAIAAFKEFTERAIQAGSAMEETSGVINSMLGDSADAAEQWAKRVGASMGRATQFMRFEFAGSVNKLKGAMEDLPQHTITDFAKRIVEAGVAFDKFSDRVSDAEAINAITMGVMGNTRALKQLGVVIQDKDMDTYAASLGKVKDQLTDTEAAQGRFNIIMEKLKGPIEDGKTQADSYQEAMARLNSVWDNMAETLGTKLLPYVTTLVREFTLVLNLMSKMGEQKPPWWVATPLHQGGFNPLDSNLMKASVGGGGAISDGTSQFVGVSAEASMMLAMGVNPALFGQDMEYAARNPRVKKPHVKKQQWDWDDEDMGGVRTISAFDPGKGQEAFAAMLEQFEIAKMVAGIDTLPEEMAKALARETLMVETSKGFAPQATTSRHGVSQVDMALVTAAFEQQPLWRRAGEEMSRAFTSLLPKNKSDWNKLGALAMSTGMGAASAFAAGDIAGGLSGLGSAAGSALGGITGSGELGSAISGLAGMIIQAGQMFMDMVGKAANVFLSMAMDFAPTDARLQAAGGRAGGAMAATGGVALMTAQMGMLPDPILMLGVAATTAAVGLLELSKTTKEYEEYQTILSRGVDELAAPLGMLWERMKPLAVEAYFVMKAFGAIIGILVPGQSIFVGIFEAGKTLAAGLIRLALGFAYLHNTMLGFAAGILDAMKMHDKAEGIRREQVDTDPLNQMLDQFNDLTWDSAMDFADGLTKATEALREFTTNLPIGYKLNRARMEGMPGGGTSSNAGVSNTSREADTGQTWDNNRGMAPTTSWTMGAFNDMQTNYNVNNANTLGKGGNTRGQYTGRP